MASAGGLIEKWRRNANRSHKNKRHEILNQITFKSFVGGFSIWISLMAFTVFVFLIEIIVHKQVRKPNPSQFWIFFEIFIDPNRHYLLENKQN